MVVAEKNLTADVDTILAAVTPKTRMVFIANPNNPTGTYVPFDEIKRLQQALPAHVLLVLDAAYCGIRQAQRLRSRHRTGGDDRECRDVPTFSKIHGLAAAARRLDVRAGAYRRGNQPHPRPVQRVDAGDARRGRRARRTPSISERSRAHNERWLAWLTEEIGKLGLRVTPSVANFVLISLPDHEGKDRGGCRCLPHQARPDPARAEELRPARTRFA